VISVFLMPSGMLGTLLCLINAMPLFSNTARGQKANLNIMNKHTRAKFEKRSQPWRVIIDPAYVIQETS
jgi:hypothetical protein